MLTISTWCSKTDSRCHKYLLLHELTLKQHSEQATLQACYPVRCSIKPNTVTTGMYSSALFFSCVQQHHLWSCCSVNNQHLLVRGHATHKQYQVFQTVVLTLLEQRTRWAKSTEGVRRTGSAVSAQTSKKVLLPQLASSCPSGLGAPVASEGLLPIALPAGRGAACC